MQHQAQRLFLIKQIMDLSKQMNCGLATTDLRYVSTSGLQDMYRSMNENVVLWLDVFGGVFDE